MKKQILAAEGKHAYSHPCFGFLAVAFIAGALSLSSGR